MGRRELLRAGLTGFTSLTLGDFYRLKAQASVPSPGLRTAVILVWLRGGASHLETFDPKPNAPSDFRGPYQPISTNVSGIQICELLPRLSKIADKYAILRSVAHGGSGHPAGSLQVLSGDPARADKNKPIYPDWMSVAHFSRSDRIREIPNYIAINPVDRYDNFQIAGPTHLGPFKVTGNLDQPNFDIPGITMKASQEMARLAHRAGLKNS